MRNEVRRVERVTVTRVVATTGDGTEVSPVREVVTYWLDDGKLLTEVDPSPRECDFAEIERRYPNCYSDYTKWKLNQGRRSRACVGCGVSVDEVNPNCSYDVASQK